MTALENRLTDALTATASSVTSSSVRPARTLATRRTRPASARWVAAAATIAVLGTGSFVAANLGSATPHAYAATPPPLVYKVTAAGASATNLLTQLADTAGAQTLAANGHVHYQDTDAWTLFTSVAEHHATSTNSITPARRQSWTTDDGAGQAVSTIAGVHSTVTMNGKSQMFDLARLSTDPATLADQLAAGRPTVNGSAELFQAVVDLWQQQVPAPALQAAILRVLSNATDIKDEGLVTDRGGRSGHAVSVDSNYSGLPTRYTLIFSPASGMLLDYEETLTTSAGALNVPIPSVVRYVLWRTYADVANIGDIPPSA
jgi:hypothetical protein